jgi:hypothetical protein
MRALPWVKGAMLGVPLVPILVAQQLSLLGLLSDATSEAVMLWGFVAFGAGVAGLITEVKFLGPRRLRGMRAAWTTRTS